MERLLADVLKVCRPGFSRRLKTVICHLTGGFLQQTRPATKNGTPGRIEVFQYPAGPGSPPLTVWEGWGESGAAADGEQAGPDRHRTAAETALRGEFDKRMAEET